MRIYHDGPQLRSSSPPTLFTRYRTNISASAEMGWHPKRAASAMPSQEPEVLQSHHAAHRRQTLVGVRGRTGTECRINSHFLEQCKLWTTTSYEPRFSIDVVGYGAHPSL